MVPPGIGQPWRRASSAQASSVTRGMNGILQPRLVRKSTRSRPARSADPRVGRYQHYRTLQTMVIVVQIALPLGAWTLSARVLPTSPICAGAACACWSGGMVDVSETGFCSPAAAAVHPGDGPAADGAMHHALVALGFRELP